MMMPANFSAVSENEMTYVVGGSIADYLAPAMGAAEWSQLHKNLITIVGNGYVEKLLGVTVGKVFSGTYKIGDGVNAMINALNTTYTNNNGGFYGVLNAGLQVAGGLAAIYNLGFGKAKNVVNDTTYKI